MAKYYELVAYNYDKMARYNKFKDEISIKIPGVTFDSIEDIDRLTATTTYMDFFSNLKENIGSRNNVSIRVTGNGGNTYYRSAIFDNKELVRLINSLEKKTIKTQKGYRTQKYITTTTDYFVEAWAKVEQLLKEKNSDYIDHILGEKNNFAFLFRRFINSSIDEGYENEEIAKLQLAFREYDTFRKFITNYDEKKYTNYIPKNTKEQEQNDYATNQTPAKIIGGVYSPKETEPDYDKEEFLYEDEIDQMTGNDADAVPHKFSGRRL